MQASHFFSNRPGNTFAPNAFPICMAVIPTPLPALNEQMFTGD
jgi:hypothetical protein